MVGMTGYSPKAKISVLAVYEQARHICRLICEPAFCYAKQNRIDTPSKKEKTTARVVFSFLVGMTGFEPATSCSQTLKCRFFPYSTRLFGAFVSENDAFGCSYKHCFHVVRSCRWSKVWSSRFYHNSCRPSSDQALPIFCR